MVGLFKGGDLVRFNPETTGISFLEVSLKRDFGCDVPLEDDEASTSTGVIERIGVDNKTFFGKILSKLDE